MKISIASIILGFSLLFTGCAHKGIQVENLGPVSGLLVAGEFQADGTLLEANKNHKIPVVTRRDFVVQAVKGVTTEDKIHKIQIDVLNPSSRAVDLKYRVFWYDMDGMELSSDIVGWQPIQLFAKGLRSISSVSIDPRAHSFRVYVKGQEYKR